MSALTSFFLALMLHPEVQKQAQADIDRIAPNRLPSLDDYDSLPYIRAILKELLRWAPVVPLGESCQILGGDHSDPDMVYRFIPSGHGRRYLRRIFHPQRHQNYREHMVRTV